MLDFTNCNIKDVIVHQIGNRTNDEELRLSKSLLNTTDSRLRELLIKYFLYPFSNSEFYSFSFSNDDFSLNPLFQFSRDIFLSKSNFQKNSINIAKLLFEVSTHPQIKSGDLFIATFTGISIDNEHVDGFGIFKSENRQPFLKLNKHHDDFILHYEDGINIEKLDKGCLVLNTDKDNGYKVCVIDKSNKINEAHYWKDIFLNVKPCKDEYHLTSDFLLITKEYVTKQLSEEFEINNADKIDLLNRSVEYFKTNTGFDKHTFEKEVFQENSLIKSFREFDKTYRHENNIEIIQNFEISSSAVKKQAKALKKVLKLDKNFHIYIHGNSELIEQGIDESGRKYYKIYYQNEN